jgi:hypothetical protein
MLWNMTYGGTGDDFGRSIIQNSDGSYAIAGLTYSFGAGFNDVYLVKTYANGTVQQQKSYGTIGYDGGYSIVQTADGGYAIAGNTGLAAGSGEFYLVKTEIEGEFGLARTDTTANTLTLYRGMNDVDWKYVRVRIWKID